MKRFLSLLGFLLFFASIVHAQNGKISGKIIESGTGTPVSNVTIRIIDLNMRVLTDQEGFFEMKNVPFGKYTVTISGLNFETHETSIDVNSESVILPNIELKRKAGEPEGISEISTIVLDQEDENKDQNISGLLHSSDDIFTSTAGYIFGSMSFRPRGYDAYNRGVLINGTDVSDAENGRVTFNDWGGLNDAMRNKQVYNYTEPTPYAYSNIGGLTNIDTRASNYRKQIKLSYSLTNRTYRDRFMLTYSTGLMKNGWAVTLSGSRRWSQEGYVPGTFYDAWGYFGSIEKKFGTRHSLGLTIFGAPTKRGTQSATVQEAYDLSGTNYYNPNWGYQNGKKRNARVRANNEPEFILNHIWNINDKTKLTTSVNYSFGTNSWSSLNWYKARDPRPDYYRYLPSYRSALDPTDKLTPELTVQEWQNNVNYRQINWDTLIQQNRLGNFEGIQANYIVERNVTKTNQIAFNTVINKEMNSHLTITGGLNFKLYTGQHYKILDDLLGGNYWVNLDQFAERDFHYNTDSAQLNLDNPNEIIHEGGKFGYNYVAHMNDGTLWGQGMFTYNKVDFFIAASLSGTEFWRTGNYRNGVHPNTSKGDSKKFSFLDYGIKGGVTYKITGRNFLQLSGFYQTKAPYFSNTFVSPKTRNDAVPNVVSENIFGGDASYIMRSNWLKLRLTYYYTRFLHGANVISYYDDGLLTYINFLMTGIDRTHQGVEFGADIKATKTLSFFAVAALGNYVYSSRPQNTIVTDNGKSPDVTTTLYYKNFYIPSTPQTALSVGLKYNYKFWFLDVNANYYDNNWLSMMPVRRTAEAIVGLGPGDPLIDEITHEQKLRGGITMDASIGKSIRINYKYFININLSVTNFLNNTNIQNWGYEQNRFKDLNIDLFPPKYLYYYGRTYFLNISFRM